jgi:hypothetical protein
MVREFDTALIPKPLSQMWLKIGDLHWQHNICYHIGTANSFIGIEYVV